MSIYGPLEQMGIPAVVQSALLAGILLFASAMMVRRQIAATGGGVLPDEGISIRNVLEFVVQNLAQIARENMGDEYRKYFPLVGTIFFFILVSNLLGLIPGVGGASSYVETTTAWAIISVVTAEAVGIRKHGFGYIKHYLGPVVWLAPFFFILEIPIHISRIITLSVRLLANMFADHTIVSVWILLVPAIVPAIFMGLGLVIAVLQAFVFSLLTMVYIGQALEEAH
ncbi:MAG: F0F1 ATP synthase subunit A [Proteobacteria bacterium]|nr:F0F1 ATP synthase subunit A [Pseudomonadota bacterium]